MGRAYHTWWRSREFLNLYKTWGRLISSSRRILADTINSISSYLKCWVTFYENSFSQCQNSCVRHILIIVRVGIPFSLFAPICINYQPWSVSIVWLTAPSAILFCADARALTTPAIIKRVHWNIYLRNL